MERLTYRKWYCGHYHTSKKIDKLERSGKLPYAVCLDRLTHTHQIKTEDVLLAAGQHPHDGTDSGRRSGAVSGD